MDTIGNYNVGTDFPTVVSRYIFGCRKYEKMYNIRYLLVFLMNSHKIFFGTLNMYRYLLV